jgi:peptidoglycan-N-acetylglucosamine deacetylase
VPVAERAERPKPQADTLLPIVLNSTFWLRHLPPEHRGVVLTFDDGPHPDTTPALLEVLAHERIRATHFLVGERCLAHPMLVRELAGAGQHIANHGFHHKSLLWHSAAFQKRSISYADSALHAEVQTPALWFRPPFGRFNWWTAPALKELHYRGVLWSVIIRDWLPASETDLWERLKTKLHSGAIIVLHDGHPTTPMVTRLLPRLAEEVARRGWTFMSLPTNDPNLTT